MTDDDKQGGTAPDPGGKVARHLAGNPREFAVTQFEQGLICAAEAFYRFYGALLGREGRMRGISGQDNVVLQQILAASRPLSVADIARFANRDDIANIQYSLKKLLRAELIRKAGRTSARETSYEVTGLAREWTAAFVNLRRELFTDPSAQILDFDAQLATCGKLLNTIAGFYDHGTRVMSGREQIAPDAVAPRARPGPPTRR
ncbi:winged helix DNA-binding protein [Thalassobaculum sp.]|uniref:winged helix DNA-binding protein n=1 Tax=Thalassobaculum sp. TaxID=2022740 RepID=UPI0032EAA992